MKKVFDLFCGTKSIGRKAEELGHKVFTVDINPEFNPDVCCNILDFDVNSVPFIPDMIWASPPCTFFSVASIGHHWHKDHTPKTEKAKIGIKIVKKTIAIIEHFQKQNHELVYYIENPRGKLRKLEFMQKFMRQTVSYCQYGHTAQKPTDIWTNNMLWNPKPVCRPGATCHESAPRGSKKGTQGIQGSKDRSRIPERLCEEVIVSALTDRRM